MGGVRSGRHERLSGRGTTFDVDLLVSVSREGMGRVAEAAQAAGWTVGFLHSDGTILRTAHPDLGAADPVAIEVEHQRIALQPPARGCHSHATRP